MMTIKCPYDDKPCNAFEPRGYCRYGDKDEEENGYRLHPCMKLSERQIREGYKEHPEILKDIDRKKKSSKSKSKRKVCKCKK